VDVHNIIRPSECSGGKDRTRDQNKGPIPGDVRQLPAAFVLKANASNIHPVAPVAFRFLIRVLKTYHFDAEALSHQGFCGSARSRIAWIAGINDSDGAFSS
jgi:hypothetical protein